MDSFIVKLKARAVEKKKEMESEEEARRLAPPEDDEEYVELTKEEREAMGPGGLDPLEVYESLPEILQEAFKAQDLAALQQALNDPEVMSPEEAKGHIDVSAPCCLDTTPPLLTVS